MQPAAASPAPAAPLLGANLLCIASMAVWAAGLPAADLVIPHLPPMALTALRMALAAAFLLPVWVLVEGTSAVARAPWARGAAIGAVALALGSVCLIVAQARTDAVTVAVISAMAPVVGIALECLFDGRRLTLRIVAALVLSLAGGLAAYFAARGAVVLGLGALAAFASVTAFVWGSRLTVTHLPALSPLGRTALTVTGAAAVSAVLALAEPALTGRAPDWAGMGAREWAALALFGMGSIGVSQLLWIVSVGRLGIGVASIHLNAVPFWVMLIVWATGGLWAWPQAAGAAVVVAGALLAQSGARR